MKKIILCAGLLLSSCGNKTTSISEFTDSTSVDSVTFDTVVVYNEADSILLDSILSDSL